MRKQGGKTVHATIADGIPLYRVRAWDSVTKRQIERIVEGLDPARELLDEFNKARRRPGRLVAEKVRVTDVAARHLVAYKTKRDGTPRPKSSLSKERHCLNNYLLPNLGAWIGDLDLPDLNATIRDLKLQVGTSASSSGKSTVASVLRRLFAWARAPPPALRTASHQQGRTQPRAQAPAYELPAMIGYIDGGAVAGLPQDRGPLVFLNPAQATTVARTSPPTVSAKSPDPGPVPPGETLRV
jgi:hypothetical protein